MKKICAIVMAICFALCGCSSSAPAANGETGETAKAVYVPRSSYNQNENYIYNAYTGIDFSLPEKWTVYTDSHSLGQLHNLTEEERTALDNGRWEDISSIRYIPDFILYGKKGGDKISIVYYPKTEDITAESCCEDYVDMFRQINADLRESYNYHQKMYPVRPSNWVSEEDRFEKESDSQQQMENAGEKEFIFYTASIKADYWGKDAYEYGAFAEIDEDYIIGILFSTTSNTDVESFWNVLGFE